MNTLARTPVDVAKSEKLRDDYLALADRAMKLAKGTVKKGASPSDQGLAMDGVGILFKKLGKQQLLISLLECHSASTHAEDQAEAARLKVALRRLENKMASELPSRRSNLKRELSAP